MNKEVQDSLKQVGIRMVEEPPLLSSEPMNNPEAAVRVLGEWLSEMDRELFCVVNLNTNLTPINMNVVSMGALNTVYVNPRETMKSAILSNAAYLMLVHNHPSGSLNPSKEDITITDRIQNAAAVMGIPVLDHIIVGRNQEFFSLRENNIFSFANDIQYTSELSKLQWTQQMSAAERSSYGNRGSEKESKLDTIMKSLEEGVEKIFTSDQYHIYLDTMAKFHNYSFNNTLLIAMQRPNATLVAGYQNWQKKFQRHVKRGEKGIKIIAPAPVKEKREVEKVDEETQEIIIGLDGQPETEVVERILPRFRVTTVFDVSQTDGEPLPALETRELDGDVIIYEDFLKGLEELSPVPFQFIEIESGAKGYYSNSEKYIAIQNNMSQAQTMKTAVHETAHAILHDRDIMEENGMTKDRMTKEVEAESVAYVVCNHFGLDTSDYSFSYIASWSSGKEMSELRSSMDTIRTTSSQFISDITDRLQELQKNRELEKENDDKVINSDADQVVTEWRKAIDERTIFARTDDFYAIYQYDHTDGDWGYEFMGLDFVENMGLSVDGQDYRIMYIGTLDQTETLDTLFQKFNIDKPEDFEGHSMSTSDVIIIKRDGEMKAYYVDSIGFKELPEFALQRADLLERSMEQETPSVYRGTLEQAVEEGKADAYLDSRRLNIDCKNAIEKAISENYDGISLNPNTANAVLNIVDIYGEQRVSFVLANTLHQLSKDGRFSERNKQWGKTIEIPENIRQGVDLNRDYIINSHPAVLNVFIDLVRKEFRDRNLEETLETRVAQITANTKGFEAEGHEGTWYVFDQKVYQGETFSLMRHERYGSRVADIVVAEDGTLVAEDVWYGFDTKVQEVIFDYLREHGITIETNEPKQSEDSVTFYAAECMEFPNMGEFYENLTLEEAIEKYESIPAERMNAVKGIGFELHDGSDYEGKYDLMHLGQVDRGNVEMVQHYQKNPIIMNALNRLEQYCGEKKQSADKIIQSERTQDTTRKKKQYQIQKGLYR